MATIDEMIFDLTEWKLLNSNNLEFCKDIDKTIKRMKEDPEEFLKFIKKRSKIPVTTEELEAAAVRRRLVIPDPPGNA
jgi:hypothetical protein